MEIVFESTDEFARSLTRLSEPERANALDEVERWVPLLLTDKRLRERRLHQFCQFHLKENCHSSLYSFIVNSYIRIILAIDEDPLFDRLSVTLFEVVESREAAAAYQRVGESIYRTLMEKSEPLKS